MGEFEIIEKYFAKSSVSEDVVLGIGDDCAVVNTSAGRQLVMSIDTLVEGVHFPFGAPPEKIGARAMSVALSDLAAMGAQPHWFTLALTLPQTNEEWISAFSEGLLSVAQRFECSLIGGDTTRGPLCISIQVHGSVLEGFAIKRSGARPDDMVFVTGTLGDGGAGLGLIQNQFHPRSFVAREYLSRRFYSPTPRILEGEVLSGMASAAIDISDGLMADLKKLCAASGVGAVVDVGRLPIAEEWLSECDPDQARNWALGGGDDYELCFTVPKANFTQVESWIRSGKLRATPIGKITHATEVLAKLNGQRYSSYEGYVHFG